MTPEPNSSIAATTSRSETEGIVPMVHLEVPNDTTTLTSTSQNVSEEPCFTSNAPNPQGCLPKSVDAMPASSSTLFAIQGPATDDDPPSLVLAREQHAQHMLNTYHIKVRDFAYESTLPPLASVHRKVEAGPRPLKRTRAYLEPEGTPDPDVQTTYYTDSNATDPSQGELVIKKPKPLARRPTEPADTFLRMPALRAMGLGTFYAPRAQPYAPAACADARTPSTPTKASCAPVVPQSSLGIDVECSQGTSHDSEPWVDTPPVTPGGSYILHVADSTSPLQLDGASQRPPPAEDVTISQRGFSSGRLQTSASLELPHVPAQSTAPSSPFAQGGPFPSAEFRAPSVSPCPSFSRSPRRPSRSPPRKNMRRERCDAADTDSGVAEGSATRYNMRNRTVTSTIQGPGPSDAHAPQGRVGLRRSRRSPSRNRKPSSSSSKSKPLSKKTQR
ncbi:hypothetical protein A0H81_03876 [Grifola frondosa]|uniref:Uncharacterized protein n=1 Tax=Grifola frondosa TaxID=5627 RepID=A0A1C7MI32_GRIFR|nr:hypothetical protein A0H81_03876 [Grifola frondosa]